MKIKEFTTELSRRLRDTKARQWAPSDLVNAMNSAFISLCNARPDAHTVERVMVLRPGSRQQIDPDLHRTVDILYNINRDGSDGIPVTLADRGAMDQGHPEWRADRPRPHIHHWLPSPREEDRFDVWPPAPGATPVNGSGTGTCVPDAVIELLPFPVASQGTPADRGPYRTSITSTVSITAYDQGVVGTDVLTGLTVDFILPSVLPSSGPVTVNHILYSAPNASGGYHTGVAERINNADVYLDWSDPRMVPGETLRIYVEGVSYLRGINLDNPQVPEAEYQAYYERLWARWEQDAAYYGIIPDTSALPETPAQWVDRNDAAYGRVVKLAMETQVSLDAGESPAICGCGDEVELLPEPQPTPGTLPDISLPGLVWRTYTTADTQWRGILSTTVPTDGGDSALIPVDSLVDFNVPTRPTGSEVNNYIDVDRYYHRTSAGTSHDYVNLYDTDGVTRLRWSDARFATAPLMRVRVTATRAILVGFNMAPIQAPDSEWQVYYDRLWQKWMRDAECFGILPEVPTVDTTANGWYDRNILKYVDVAIVANAATYRNLTNPDPRPVLSTYGLVSVLGVFSKVPVAMGPELEATLTPEEIAASEMLSSNDDLPFDQFYIEALYNFALYYCYAIDDDVSPNSGRGQRHWLTALQIINKMEASDETSEQGTMETDQ